jgi:pimeloyl-ACP methyl ester carboxylesterase
MMGARRTVTVSAAGLNWAVHEAGAVANDSRPLLLLHGGGVDSAELSYGDLIERIATTRRVIAPDLPGYGDTERPEAPYTMEWYIDTLHRLTDVLGLRLFDLGGLSLGGGLSIGYTLNYPQRVRRLVLMAPYGLTTKVPLMPQRLALLMMRVPDRLSDRLTRATLARPWITRLMLRPLVRNRARRTNELVTAVMQAGRAPDSGRAFRVSQRSEIQRTGLRTCYLDRLGSIDQPTLLLSGRQDRVVPSSDCRKAASLISHARLEILKPCGHWIGRDQPDQVASLIHEFLETKDPTAS